ncbi:PPIC-type PPIASE domain-containing protein [Gracilibacillus ureilyticus]|uniref:peptidylprolyl isomerase n=1 Tax=Gracilibacillus ureilyticus TaxID=531814 RepID=A0A1H9VLJ5_9BACI|nr:peptidyl-prolyl cis-trans isomerase [Gracilibacillus ureilyticus]SES22575.1 PPIC-type PPIASE domain-containing protein [Gracilibacillus ureilyticus]
MGLSKLSLWIIIFLLLITNIFTLFFRGSPEEESFAFAGESGPLATVNGNEVSRSELIQRVMDDYGPDALVDIVNEEVVFSLAEENNLVIEEKLIEREISRMLVMRGLLGEEEKKELIADWERRIKYRYYLQQLLTRNVEIDNAEAEQYYEIYKNQYNFEQRVQLSHIILPTMEDAEKVLEELDSGKNFAEAARQYSIDDSGSDGGYLGFYSETSSFLPAEYFEQALALENNYSDPIETSQGIAIIYVHQNLPAITLDYEEVSDEVKQDIALERLDQEIDATTLWDELEVKTILDDD